MIEITHFESGISDVDVALKAAKLDWTVSLDTLTNPRTGKPTDYKLIYRDDTDEILAQHKSGYQAISNREHFEYLSNFAQLGGYEFIGMGSKGGKVFAQVEIGQYNVGGLSPTKRIVTCLASHDGSLMTSYHPTSTVIVCQNTFMANVGQSKTSAMRFKKTKNIQNKLDTGEVLIQLAAAEEKNLLETFDSLTKIRMSPAQLKEHVLNALYPIKEDSKRNRAGNIHTEILELAESNDNGYIPELAGTAWTAFNSITNFLNHSVGNEKEKDSAKLAEQKNARAFGMIDSQGNGFKKANQALELVLKFAESAPVESFKAFSFPSWETEVMDI